MYLVASVYRLGYKKSVEFFYMNKLSCCMSSEIILFFFYTFIQLKQDPTFSRLMSECPGKNKIRLGVENDKSIFVVQYTIKQYLCFK